LSHRHANIGTKSPFTVYHRLVINRCRFFAELAIAQLLRSIRQNESAFAHLAKLTNIF